MFVRTTIPGLALFFAGLSFPALPAFLPAADLSCSVETILYQDDCLTVEAVGISSSGGGTVTASGVDVRVDSACDPITTFDVVTYRDKDGKRGFTDPPDEPIGGLHGGSSNHSTYTLSLGALSNHDPMNGSADAWEFTATHPDGTTTTGCGTFNF